MRTGDSEVENRKNIDWIQLQKSKCHLISSKLKRKQQNVLNWKFKGAKAQK